MPLLGTRGAASARGFGFTALLGGGYWIGTLSGSGSSNEVGRGVAVDSSGNVYIAGQTADNVLIAKYNTSGTIQWQRILGGAGTDQGFGIAVDSSGNVYVTGYTASQGAGLQDVLITKYDTSGTIQWQRILGGSYSDYGQGIAVDSSGNVYVTGYTNSPSGEGEQDILIAKYDTSGTIQWQRTLGTGSSSDNQGYGIAVDSSGNVYIAGQTADNVLIAKYNTSGTIQWQRTLGNANTEYGYGIAVDSSGNSYIVGRTNGSGAGAIDVLIAKYDTSGTIQWQRILGGASDDFGYAISVDSSANVYITGITQSQGVGVNDVLIAKYNTSGTIQWQRILGGTYNDLGQGIAVDSSGNVYVTGYTLTPSGGTQADVLFAKLPGDGSKTGTYTVGGVSFTYAASTLTAATSAFTAATSTLTSSTSAFTAATSTLTSATSTLTSSVTTI